MQFRIKNHSLSRLKNLLKRDYNLSEKRLYYKGRAVDQTYPRYVISLKETLPLDSILVELYLEIKPTSRYTKTGNIIVHRGTSVNEEMFRIRDELDQ